MSFSISDIANLNVHDSDYRCNIFAVSKSKVIIMVKFLCWMSKGCYKMNKRKEIEI